MWHLERIIPIIWDLYIVCLIARLVFLFWHLERWIVPVIWDRHIACVPVWHLEHSIKRLLDSHACVPVYHLELGVIATETALSGSCVDSS